MMMLSEVSEHSKDHYILRNLFSIKRLFGPQASITLVTKDGEAVCSTVADLIDHADVSPKLAYLDEYFKYIPTIYDVPINADCALPWDPPVCPWVTAKVEQLEAKSRAFRRRAEVLSVMNNMGGR